MTLARHPRRRPGSRPSLGALALLAFVLTSLVACGDDGGEEDGERTSPSVTQVGSSPATTAASSTTDARTDPGDTTEPGTPPQVGSVVAASVHEPIVLLPKPGDPGHLWVAERAGKVRRLSITDDGDTLESTGPDLLDITSETSTEAERGLLGMAFSPAGDELYLSFTDPNGNSLVVAYPVEGTTIDERGRRTLFAVDQPYPNHNGGNIVLGPDSKLWLGLGDGGSADDPENRAQDPTTPLGKVLRIDPATGEHEIVASGLRNPWRFAFDTDGSLWIADVGQQAIEEINHLAPGEVEGANFGWSGYEGTEPYLDGDGRRPADPVMPVFQYSHDDGNCSITGGFPYHGAGIEGLQGAYLFADYCAGRVRAIVLGADGGFSREYDLGIDVENPISFGYDQQGELYVLSAGGNIVRLIDAS